MQSGASAPEAAPAAPAVPIARLAARRWDPVVKNALEEFIASRGSLSPGYDPQAPPVAVLPWNDAAIINDAGLAVFYRLLERADFKFDDDFWRVVPVAYGRQRLRSAYEQFFDEPVSTWPRQPTYLQYRKGFLRAYEDMCRKVGRGPCRAWLAKLVRGFKDKELTAYVGVAVSEEAQKSLEDELVRDSPEDAAPVVIRRGLAEVLEMKDLSRLLLNSGFDVWVIDTDLQKALAASSAGYGIHSSRAEGLRLATTRELLIDVVASPVPIRSGKVEIVAASIGRAPQFIVGATPEDADLMAYGSGLRIYLNQGDESMRALAEEKGWLLQPAFVKHEVPPRPHR